MAIYYRTITNSAAEPTNPYIGDIWICPIDSSTYQVYMYYNDEWRPLAGGGTYAAETNPDTHYINVVVQEDEPNDIIQLGWFWIKESVPQAYLYLGEYVPIGV